jgi:hypothetical protein
MRGEEFGEGKEGCDGHSSMLKSKKKVNYKKKKEKKRKNLIFQIKTFKMKSKK